MPTVYRDSFSRRGQIVVESISAYHGPNCYTILLARSTINARRCRVVSASDCGVRGSRFESHRGRLCLSRQQLRSGSIVSRDFRRQKRRRIMHRLHTTQLLHRDCVTIRSIYCSRGGGEGRADPLIYWRRSLAPLRSTVVALHSYSNGNKSTGVR